MQFLSQTETTILDPSVGIQNKVKAQFRDFATLSLSAERMQRRCNPTIPSVVLAWPHFLFYFDVVQIFVHGTK